MKKLSVKEVVPKEVKLRDGGICISCSETMWVPFNQMAGMVHDKCKNPSETYKPTQFVSIVKDKQDKPSETDETPVESVSQPKAVDGYLKEFDELFVFTLKVMGEIRKRGGWNGNTATPETVKAFLKSSIERARQEERNKQILGYEKGQREERQRVVEMVEGMYPYEEIEKFKGMDYMEIVQEVKLDLKSKLEKNEI